MLYSEYSIIASPPDHKFCCNGSWVHNGTDLDPILRRGIVSYGACVMATIRAVSGWLFRCHGDRWILSSVVASPVCCLKEECENGSSPPSWCYIDLRELFRSELTFRSRGRRRYIGCRWGLSLRRQSSYWFGGIERCYIVLGQWRFDRHLQLKRLV